MSATTRQDILNKLRRRYEKAGPRHKSLLLDQAVELLGYHRKAAIRALGAPEVKREPRVNRGRPARYEPGLLGPWLRPIWQATDYACGRRLVAMLPDWIPAYEAHERRMPVEVREKLLSASARTLDRLLEPLRVQSGRASLTRPGTLLRQQIPIRGSVWEEGKPGWLEVDTVALQDVEERLPFALLGLDSDNGGEFLNHHVLRWLQRRERPVFMTRSRPYKKDDNAHVEQKNWTHIRQWFGYERHDNPEVVEPMNELARGPYGQLLNYFHASLKLKSKERKEGRMVRVYEEARTPLARVLESGEVTEETKQRLVAEKGRLNPFALKREVARRLKEIAGMRRAGG